MKIKHGKHTSHSARRPFLLCSSRPKPTVSSLVLQQSISCSLPYLLSTFPVDLTYHFLPRFPPSTLSCISASNFRKHPVLNHRTCLKKKNKQTGRPGRLPADLLISLCSLDPFPQFCFFLQQITTYRCLSSLLLSPVNLTDHSFTAFLPLLVISKAPIPASIHC